MTNNPADYEEHPGPLIQGDIIVLQVEKWLLPRADRSPGPQWFIVRQSQQGAEPVPLALMETPKSGFFARRYKCGWRPSEFAERLQTE